MYILLFGNIIINYKVIYLSYETVSYLIKQV